MSSTKLRPWQIKKIRGSLERALGYLTRLKRRMEVTGFPPEDPLFQATLHPASPKLPQRREDQPEFP